MPEPTTSEAQRRAVAKHRASKRRIDLQLAEGSPEVRALDRLIDQHGNTTAAIRAALLASAGRD